ncbi:MAG TPA: indolepyruvate ferredoxin oxidoreductase subunit alpha [Thermoleophilia bacterium]|nr:indolepyruvate ferredoxin oxidoreductase subunit alpha [Thermoleophilia bacterium]
MERVLFYSGNEAIAYGAVRAGAGFACGYPGTPSTEIIETAANIDGIHAQWCINEKVALETAVGASLAGVRSLVTMKHVGLNVAADPFMTLSLTGVNAGLVIVSADDPGMHSSQNEQDSRTYAKFARVPMLEPSDSQEAYDFLAEAFALSEEFDTPVLLRTTTRLSHGRGRVLPRIPVELEPRDYKRDSGKYVMVPAHARARNRVVLERLQKLRVRSEESPLNVLEAGSADLGIIASGITYAYCREAFPQAWFLKLGMSHPLPFKKVAKLYQQVSRVAVVEELDPFIEEQVRALNLPVIGKEAIPADGELDQEIVFSALEPFLRRRPPRRRRVQLPAPLRLSASAPLADLPVRPPVLCPGCAHRSVYTALQRRKLAFMGDIGCYTLGALPPLAALDTCLCMGASIGMMAGFNKALGRKAAVGVIGDSTFFHSGITALIDALYNQAEGLVMVLDNRTTAMTGHQGHPGTGLQAQGTYGPATDIQRLCEGIGVRCETVDANDFKELERSIRDEIDAPGLGVVVALAPCVLEVREKRGAITVDEERCNLCGLCLKLGCPAIVPGEMAVSISAACTGCALCVEVCRRGALSFVAAAAEGAGESG